MREWANSRASEERMLRYIHSLLMTFRINISMFKICNVLLPYGYIVFQCHDHDLHLILFYIYCSKRQSKYRVLVIFYLFFAVTVRLFVSYIRERIDLFKYCEGNFVTSME